MTELTSRATDSAGNVSASFAFTIPTTPPVVGELWSSKPRTGHVTISNAVVLDVDATVDSLTIAAGGSLTFHPDHSLALASEGNIIDWGLLRSKPSGSTVQHTIRFPWVVESAMVGGGMDPIASDVGLWVMGDGVLDLQGTPKTAWIHAGDTPQGWQVGDQLVIAPTKRGVDTPKEVVYNGSPPVTGPNHPNVNLGPADLKLPPGPSNPDVIARPEILNLTRNVVIEGTPTGRSHVLLRSTLPSTFKHVELRYMGPQIGTTKDDTGRVSTEGRLGRYPLHFHHAHAGSRLSLIEGCSIHHSGNHAYVPHGSEGITIRDCVAYDIRGAAYWWDEGHETHDLHWDRCAAGLIFYHPGESKYVNTAYFIGKGRALSNIAKGCVAFSVKGPDSSGFFWNNPPTDGLWVFEDCVAHNCIEGYGIRVWQNTGDDHTILRFHGYHNAIGIRHGAYGNPYKYIDCRLVANNELGIELRAQSQANGQLWKGCYVDAGGALYAVRMMDGGPVPDNPAKIVEDCRFLNYTKAAIHVEHHHDEFLTAWTLRRNTFSGNEMWWDSTVQDGSRMTFDGITVAKRGKLTRDRPEWNASSAS